MSRLPKVSDANLWMKCHGAHQMQERHPPLDSEPSQSRLEGRACHEAAQLMFAGETDIIGRIAESGVVITEELYDAAKVYVDDVLSVTDSPVVEQRVSLDHILPDWYCIPDAYHYDPESHTVTLWDFKAGHGYVPAEENYQLLLGIEGVVNRLDMTGVNIAGLTLSMRIVQPRCYTSEGSVREWCISLDDYYSLIADVETTLVDITSDDPTCTTGEHCRKCSGRRGCTALQRDVYAGIDYTQSLQTHGLSGDALGLELRLLRRAAQSMQAMLDGLEEQALHEIKSGQGVSGFGVKAGTGRRRWKADIDMLAIGDLMGVDLREPVKTVTPAQAVKKGIDTSVIDAYSEKPSTGLKLVEVNVNQLFK